MYGTSLYPYKKAFPFHEKAALPFTEGLGREGFEPSKTSSTDLQSAPFDRSGISPEKILSATSRIRTEDPEITSHVLWPAELRWRLFQPDDLVK